MKTALQTSLTHLAPSIVIETLWEHDPDAHSEWKTLAAPGNALHGEDPDNWECWQSEVRARAIWNGTLLTGSAYLGGTWEKAGDDPRKSNPEISGYEPQMTDEALTELAKQLPPHHPALTEIEAARSHLYATTT
jgi:hypothetical protein